MAVHPSAAIAPHSDLEQTSTVPSVLTAPPTRRTAPLEQTRYNNYVQHVMILYNATHHHCILLQQYCQLGTQMCRAVFYHTPKYLFLNQNMLHQSIQSVKCFVQMENLLQQPHLFGSKYVTCMTLQACLLPFVSLS